MPHTQRKRIPASAVQIELVQVLRQPIHKKIIIHFCIRNHQHCIFISRETGDDVSLAKYISQDIGCVDQG